MKKNKLLTLLMIGCMVFNLTACGTSHQTSRTSTSKNNTEASQKLTKVKFVLDWTPNTNHTGLYAAQQLGYYRAAGLDVSIIQPPDNGALSLVASEGAQFGIEFQDTMAAALAKDDPLPITAVAAVLQHNTSGIISLKRKGIDRPAKMMGHRYATWDSPIEQAVIKESVNGDGGNYQKVKMISTTVENIVAALHSNIDSVWIYQGWDGIKCREEGLKTNFFMFKDINPVFDYYTPVIISNTNYLKKNPKIAKAFMAATQKGYEYAAKYPAKAAKILLKAAPELDKTLVTDSQKYLSTQYLAEAAHWGKIDPKRWNAFYQWLDEKKLVKKAIKENTGFTNDYLPAE